MRLEQIAELEKSRGCNDKRSDSVAVDVRYTARDILIVSL